MTITILDIAVFLMIYWIVIQVFNRYERNN
jgi:hypothetical protein